MKNTRIASKALAALGTFIVSIAALVAAPTAGAYPGYGYGYGQQGCRNGYQPARYGFLADAYGAPPNYGVNPNAPAVCSHPSNIEGRGFLNAFAQRIPAPPPERFLPPWARLDASLPPCMQYDRRTFDGFCSPAWVPLGY